MLFCVCFIMKLSYNYCHNNILSTQPCPQLCEEIFQACYYEWDRCVGMWALSTAYFHVAESWPTSRTCRQQSFQYFYWGVIHRNDYAFVQVIHEKDDDYTPTCDLIERTQSTPFMAVAIDVMSKDWQREFLSCSIRIFSVMFWSDFSLTFSRKCQYFIKYINSIPMYENTNKKNFG